MSIILANADMAPTCGSPQQAPMVFRTLQTSRSNQDEAQQLR